MTPKDITWDLESTGLLNSSSIDYSTVPYKLKESFKIHCIVVEFDDKIVAFHDGPKFVFDGRPYNVDYSAVNDAYSYTFEGYEPIDYVHRPLSDFTKFLDWIPEGSRIIAHNQINFDLLVIKLYFGIDYKVEIGMDTPLGDDTWNGKPVVFDDTMVRSKTLNPDRFGGHSLENLATGSSDEKMDFRPHIPRDFRFLLSGADMVYYNILDVKANKLVAKKLDAEMTLWDWGDKWHPAIKLEKQTVELITRQEHRGFAFDKNLAEECLAELDAMMEERKVKVEAIIPPRPATKGYMKDFTPPKLQFKKATGEPSANLVKFAEKLGAEIKETEEGYEFWWEGKRYPLPLPEGVPLKTTMTATINDTTHIKEWLVSLGWSPLEYKEKDLTVDSKKIKLSPEKLDAAIERYIEQTMYTEFRKDRMEFLELPATGNEQAVRARLIKFFDKRKQRGGGLKVQTNPSFTVGQEKEICPNLKKIAESSEELACITDITEYLTYRHRRNSILGGGQTFEDFEDDTDEQTSKGYLANIREDGRIPTPAGTCDAATSRMRHRLVVNVPRSTSLYGEKMRALFMADNRVAWQLGYDFSSLEARIEGHYCWIHEEDEFKAYCNSLIQEKPNDVHTMMAKRISEIIASDFGRSPAKNVKYGATYGAQAAKIAKTIGSTLEVGQIVFDAFWEAAAPLAKLKDALKREWEKKFQKKRIIGIDGRLIPTRHAHAILNSLFQGGGVVCAKKVMVYHDRLAAAEGMIVDFFKQSLDEVDNWWQQMIAMHDEAQGEVNKEAVTFKVFTKEALGWQKIEHEDRKIRKDLQAAEDARCEKVAADWKATQKGVWSDVQHTDKGWFVAYCRQGELISQAVQKVNDDFNLNVPLDAGYVLGRSWKDCH
ncbi:DNA polymerase I [compost metagenome]